MMNSDDAPKPPELNESNVEQAVSDLRLLRAELLRVYQGPARTVEHLLVAMTAGGHVLLEGVPGVAKTTLVASLAQCIDGAFRRIQFTPDLLPGDITGSSILNMRTSEFEFRAGPVFAHVLLGDEINRAPAKTQSALLEAMEEGRVTVEGMTYALPTPFMVLATQNPVEQEGVYPLPEAQLDRFMLRIRMGYPTLDQELAMLSTRTRSMQQVRTLLTTERMLQLRQLAEQVHVSPTIQRYVVDLTRATRSHSSVRMGASPRASLALMRASRSRALLGGRDFVHVDDVRDLAASALAHRLLLQPGALMAGTDPTEVIDRLVRDVRYDSA
jgi:MoxR-like ATPase